MTTLQEKINALPEWPTDKNSRLRSIDFFKAQRNAALPRLALAREVIRDRIQIQSDADYIEICGLLAALEGP